MTNKLKKANLRRLASLSALGAGALGVGAVPAEAYIVYSGVIDKKVGFGSGYGPRATIVGPGFAAGVLFTRAVGVTLTTVLQSKYVGAVTVRGRHGTNLQFIKASSFISAFPPEAKFGTPATAKVGNRGAIAASGSVNGQTGHFTLFNTTDRYLLFKFSGGKLPYPIYGWAQLSVTLPGNLAGPKVTLVSYAWETSGAQLPAGVHGKKLDGSDDTSAIEPSTSDSTGLSALSLGAAGLRTWRAARQAQAATH